MTDAATTNRGLNALLLAASLAPVASGDNTYKLPNSQRGDIQVFGDFSTKALFLDAGSRSATTKKLNESARTGVVSLADNDWHSIDWDPEVGRIDFWCNDVTGTDGVEFTTGSAVAANAGMELPEGQLRSFFVAGAPTGRLWVRRTAAGNGGNGSNTVKLNYIAHGTRNMLQASGLNADVAHS